MSDAGPNDAETPPPATCPVCAAPALPVRGSCIFCASPLAERGDPSALLGYVADRLPGVSLSRAGLLHRGAPQRIELTLGGTEFRAQVKKAELELTPAGTPEQWAATLVRTLGRLAPDDRDQRSVLRRTGWTWVA